MGPCGQEHGTAPRICTMGSGMWDWEWGAMGPWTWDQEAKNMEPWICTTFILMQLLHQQKACAWAWACMPPVSIKLELLLFLVVFCCLRGAPTRLHTFSQQQKIMLMIMHKMGLGTWDHVAKNMGQHQEYALWGQECGTGNGEPWGHEHGTRRPRTWNHEFAQHLFSCNCFINRKLVHEPEHACHLFQAWAAIVSCCFLLFERCTC